MYKLRDGLHWRRERGSRYGRWEGTWGCPMEVSQEAPVCEVVYVPEQWEPHNVYMVIHFRLLYIVFTPAVV